MKSFDKKVLVAFIFTCIGFSVLLGCSSSQEDTKPEVDNEKEALIENPKITKVSNLDGCEVKYVQTYRRELLNTKTYYYSNSNFYIASCDVKSTTTTTVGNDKYNTLNTVIKK